MDVVRVEETANDAQLWGDQGWGGGAFSPLGLEGQEGPAGPPQQRRQATCGLGVAAQTPLPSPPGLGGQEARRWGDTQMQSPEASLGPEQWWESWRAQAVDPPPHPEGRMCPCSFPALGGLDERPQGEDSGGRGSADRAGGVARAGSGNPRGRCPQRTRIPFSGKQAVTCPGHTHNKRQRWIQGPLLPKEGACAESNHSALCKTKTVGLIRPCLVPNQ